MRKLCREWIALLAFGLPVFIAGLVGAIYYTFWWIKLIILSNKSFPPDAVIRERMVNNLFASYAFIVIGAFGLLMLLIANDIKQGRIKE